jgi:hypothetical protein
MKLSKLIMPLSLIVMFSLGGMFGAGYVYVTDPDNNPQKFKKNMYVVLSESKTLYLEGDQKKTLELPAGTVMYYEFSHKDFDSYASVQLKADYLNYESIVEPIENPAVYVMSFSNE